MKNSIEIGKTRDDPIKLYDLCVLLSDQITLHPAWDTSSPACILFREIVNALWSSLPQVVVIDLGGD